MVFPLRRQLSALNSRVLLVISRCHRFISSAVDCVSSPLRILQLLALRDAHWDDEVAATGWRGVSLGCATCWKGAFAKRSTERASRDNSSILPLGHIFGQTGLMAVSATSSICGTIIQ
jgi:hypothetical protein